LIFWECFLLSVWLVSAITSLILLAPNISPTISNATRSWIPLTIVETRGFIKNYTVLYTPVIFSQKRQLTVTMYKTVDWNQRSAIVDGLDENAAYALQMLANTGGGQGTVGTIVVVSPFGEY